MIYHLPSLFHRRYWPAWVVLALGATASVGLGWRQHEQAVELDKKRLLRIAETVRDQLRTKLQTTDLIMRHAQDYFGSLEDFSEGMFREWCRKYGWSITAPWMHGLAFYTNVNAGRWRGLTTAVVARWEESDFRTFAACAKNSKIQLELAFSYSHDNQKRWPAHYATTFEFGRSYTGFLGCIPANTPQTTDREVVIELEDGGVLYGATLGVPIYETMRDALRDLVTGPSRKVSPHSYNWNMNRGVLLSPIDYVALGRLVRTNVPKEVGVEIYASPKPNRKSWLNEAGQPSRAFDNSFKPYLSLELPWQLYNGNWTLFFYTLPEFEAGSPRYLARLTTVAGITMTILATALVGIGLRGRIRQELMTEQIREARDALAAAERQRQKLSHDLHDNTVQSLYAVQLNLGRTEQKLATNPAQARHELQAVRSELDSVIAETRRFITQEERTPIKGELAGVLQALVQRARQGASTQVELTCDQAASGRLSSHQAVQLANVAREALSNSLRHARSHNICIHLRSETDKVCLEIADDGIGFDTVSPKAQGVGLTSMRARAAEIGGELDIYSAAGNGTRMVIRVAVDAIDTEVDESTPDQEQA